MPSFDELLAGKGVFQDKSVLSPHYIPETLLYREEEIKRIMLGVAPVLQGTKAKNIFLYGLTGCGKTCSVKQVMEKLREKSLPGVHSVYVNCRVYDTRYKVLQKIITDFKPHFAKTGHSFTLLFEELVHWLEEGPKKELVAAFGSGDSKSEGQNIENAAKQNKGRHLVVVLDEVDAVADLDNLVYTLVRTNDEVGKGSVSILGISNKVDFKRKIDARVKTSLCEEELVFQPYDAPRLAGILSQRVPQAFEKEVVDDSAVNLAAAIAAGENGDARYALLLLQKAGELCESKGLRKLTDSEVEEARKLADEDKAFEVISSLPEHQKFLLYSLAGLVEDVTYKRLVEDGGEKLYFSGEVYERYARLAKQSGKEPRSARWYREYLNELEMLGLITTIQSGKGVRGHTTLIKLAYEPARVKKAVEKTLLKE